MQIAKHLSIAVVLSLIVFTLSACFAGSSAQPQHTPHPTVQYGYMDETGKIVIEPQFETDALNINYESYSRAPLFHNGLAWVLVNYGTTTQKYGFIDLSGTLAIPAVYDVAYSFVQGTAWVCYEGKWGVIDTEGNWVTEPKYDVAKNCLDTLVPVCIEEKWGFADRKGKLVIEPRFAGVLPFFEDCAMVATEVSAHNSDIYHFWGTIDRTGAWVTPPQYYNLFEYYPDEQGWYIAVKDNTQFPLGAYINHRGERMTDYDFQVGGGSTFQDDRAFVFTGYRDNPRDYCIDREGQVVYEYSRDDYIHPYSNGLARMGSTGNYTGYCDKDGNLAFEVEADWMDDFSEGLAHVNYGPSVEGVQDRHGFIDTSGQIALEPIYTNVIYEGFHDGLAYVLIDEKHGLIDKEGNWQLVLPPDIGLVGSPQDGALISEGLYLVYRYN